MKLITLLLLISFSNCFAQNIDTTQVIKTLKKGVWYSETKDPYYGSIYKQNINYNFKKNGIVVIKFIEDSFPIKIKGNYQFATNDKGSTVIYIFGFYGELSDIGDEYIVTYIDKSKIKLKPIRNKGIKTYETILNKKRLVTHR